MSLDLLVFGPHPDDIEIGLGGTIARHTAAGWRVGLCDLTRGEMGSNGTPEERLREAEAARAVLGAEWRENLGWPDRGITGSRDQLDDAARLIRRWRPRVVAIPYWEDRHPDHVAASRVLAEGVFNARLRRHTAVEGEAWAPEWVCYYFINDQGPISFAIDVSAHYEAKRRALECYGSQFVAEGPGAVETRLTSPSFARLISSRDAQFGALAGVPYAEGIVVKEPILRPSLLKDWAAQPGGAAQRPGATAAEGR
jgi:bacillithiol biosynthesis deacetylase BshB1